MGRFLFVYVGFVIVWFLKTAYSNFLLSALSNNLLPARKLKARQAPGVIATSDFLRRHYQASAVAGKWVYIDGGEFSFMSNGTTNYQYSTTLLSIDLSQNWTNSTVSIHSNTKPYGVPNLNNPSFWYYEKEDLFYSGFAGWSSMYANHPKVPPLSLWTFKPDGFGNGVWNEAINSSSPIWGSLTRPSMSLTAYGSNTALVVGGTDSPFDLPSPENLLPGMMQFHMDSQSFTNSSVYCCNATSGVVRGAMHYVPSFGQEGLFVAMGGENGITSRNFSAGLIDFGTVSVFDQVKQQWWNQTTTGSEPSPRIEFCTAGIDSTNGTYEIFVYAGWNDVLGPTQIQYDTINILTLPAFHWISVPYNPQNPRHGHSCNSVGGSQILTIGGVDSNPNATDGTTYASTPDPFLQGLAIFDMTTPEFSKQYTAEAQSYEQSDVVKHFYSQSQGAYAQNLVPGVAALLQVTHFANNTSTNHSTLASPPIPPPSRKHNTGVIAGGVVGGLVVLLALVASLLCCLKRLRPSKSTTPTSTNPSHSSQQGSLREMHEDARPLEFDEQGLQELSEQGLREMHACARAAELHEHSRPAELHDRFRPAELQAHAYRP